MKRLKFAVFVTAAIVLFSGCSGEPDKFKVYGVTGIVTMDDVPLEGVNVTFMPIKKGSGDVMSAGGITDAQGRYKLQTSGVKKLGAIEGEYNVVFSKITVSEMTDEERQAALLAASKSGAMPASKGTRQEIPPKYQVPGKSGFTVKVEANDKNKADFSLKK